MVLVLKFEPEVLALVKELCLLVILILHAYIDSKYTAAIQKAVDVDLILGRVVQDDNLVR